MDMNGAVSKQSGSASQGANIIKTQTSGKGGGGEEGQRGGSRVRSHLHLSPLSPLKVKGGRRRRRRKRRGKPGHFLDSVISAYRLFFFAVCLICF